ncbi:MAG: diguanylate cyclase [Synergistaceae bacterium]|nr:diguanylate cyclase [Synergistaceae bacterium]
MATQTNMPVWGGILDSCPGLLCCVINLRGILVYATHGYKAVASRLFGHKCEEGNNYPPLATEVDSGIHEILTAACLGSNNAIEISDNGRVWELTASPLRLEGQGIAGVVLRITPKVQSDAARNSMPPVVIQSSPEILNTVPFRAGVTDIRGFFLAVNKFLASSVRTELVGRNIVELVTPENNSDLTNIIIRRSGTAECVMPDILPAENFYPSGIAPYLDDELNNLHEDEDDDEIDVLRHVRLYATPCEWNGADAVMITFEDVTDSLRTHEQLRRLLTVDRSTGILNRFGIEHMITRRMHETANDGSNLSLTVIRIDNFRIMSEALGYAAASGIVRKFARMMKKFLAERTDSKDISLGRWSDDEFVILSTVTGASTVSTVNELRAKSSDVVISAGTAELSEGSYMSVSEFFGAAYDAVTEAVKSGGNTTVQARDSLTS